MISISVVVCAPRKLYLQNKWQAGSGLQAIICQPLVVFFMDLNLSSEQKYIIPKQNKQKTTTSLPCPGMHIKPYPLPHRRFGPSQVRPSFINLTSPLYLQVITSLQHKIILERKWERTVKIKNSKRKSIYLRTSHDFTPNMPQMESLSHDPHPKKDVRIFLLEH